MSLFDNIRYSNTNLDSYEALVALPTDLLELYWVEAVANPYSPLHSGYSHRQKCETLSAWVVALPSNPESFTKQDYFKSALRKYNNDDI